MECIAALVILEVHISVVFEKPTNCKRMAIVNGPMEGRFAIFVWEIKREGVNIIEVDEVVEIRDGI